MSNMSYCRFENTLPDLSDCVEALEDELSEREDTTEARAQGEPTSTLSRTEAVAAALLVARCVDCVQLAVEALGIDFEDATNPEFGDLIKKLLLEGVQR